MSRKDLEGSEIRGSDDIVGRPSSALFLSQVRVGADGGAARDRRGLARRVPRGPGPVEPGAVGPRRPARDVVRGRIRIIISGRVGAAFEE